MRNLRRFPVVGSDPRAAVGPAWRASLPNMGSRLPRALLERLVDDAAVFISKLSGGGLATFEATRFAAGRKNAIRIEINGSEGSVALDFEDMNILHFYDYNDDPEIAGCMVVMKPAESGV